MRFWDSSAIVPLCVPQAARDRALTLHESDPVIVVWWGTWIECISALVRLGRELGNEDDPSIRRAWNVLERLRDTWLEIQPSEELRTGAERVLRVHPLRASDALQLAAGLDWARDPAGAEFVTFDHRLGEAAIREGFSVLGEDA